MGMGRKKFNTDPRKGIQYLVEHGLLRSTPEDVADFLYKGEALMKSQLGNYLGERDDFNIQVLHKFVELHDFTDLILVQALRFRLSLLGSLTETALKIFSFRQFLWSFRLPGEAQKIDRMMECFAQRYCTLNPGVFTSPGWARQFLDAEVWPPGGLRRN